MEKDEEAIADETNLDASMRVTIIDGMALVNKVHQDKNTKTWNVILIEYMFEPRQRLYNFTIIQGKWIPVLDSIFVSFIVLLAFSACAIHLIIDLLFRY